MNQKNLKNKVYKVLFEKISEENFKKDIQILTDVYKPKPDSLLYDLTLINNTSDNFKKCLLEVISKYTTKEELISLKIYQECMKIISARDKETVFLHSAKLAEIYNRSKNQYQILFDFQRLNDELSYIKDDLVKTKQEDVYFNLKKSARAITDEYNRYKKKQQWNNFLQTSLNIIKHKEPIQLKQKKQIIDNAINELVNLESKSRIKRLLKENGFKDEELEKIMEVAENTSIEIMKKRLYPMLIIGIILTVYSTVILTNENNQGYYALIIFLIGIGLLITVFIMFWKIKKKK
ncbi:hypothetical protein [Kordia sp.]|uniref:hypothetical protein n=1 Tax=Kordia sp. TaxID=1965332 RepID=UPI003D6BC4ED